MSWWVCSTPSSTTTTVTPWPVILRSHSPVTLMSMPLLTSLCCKNRQSKKRMRGRGGNRKVKVNQNENKNQNERTEGEKVKWCIWQYGSYCTTSISVKTIRALKCTTAVLCFCIHMLVSCEKQSNKLINCWKQETINEEQTQRLQSAERQYLAFHFTRHSHFRQHVYFPSLCLVSCLILLRSIWHNR